MLNQNPDQLWMQAKMIQADRERQFKASLVPGSPPSRLGVWIGERLSNLLKILIPRGNVKRNGEAI